MAVGLSGCGSNGCCVCAATAEEWTAVDLLVEARISHFELGASGENVYVVTSENSGQGLKVHQLQNA